ncbi:hypothetical protein FE782_03675 [Paenibacillus antri]|uniref:Uncharacterized protein n=1 Tax=Paenibacillus antri TaxID=2582848 RepID=A0A5R9GCA5_9BACL|nr:hypothetical protein [Paenibacillus antri]TLS53381.1 hypothetical protein FE782_03675 [Paenibacillus antri]
MQIRFAQFNGLFLVSLIGYNQRLVTQPPRFRKITGISPRTVLGCMDVSAEVAVEIGFVLPKGVSGNVDVRPESEPVLVGA